MKRSFAIAATILFAFVTVLAQNLTLDSFTKARTILDKSVTAYDGREALTSINNFSVRITGESVCVASS